jgi:hypothetical protein
MHPYTITLAKPAPDLGTRGPFIVSLLIVIFAVDCDISPSLPPPSFGSFSTYGFYVYFPYLKKLKPKSTNYKKKHVELFFGLYLS